MPYYEQIEFEYERQCQERQAEDDYWEMMQQTYEEDMLRLQEIAKFPLFYWKETCQYLALKQEK